MPILSQAAPIHERFRTYLTLPCPSPSLDFKAGSHSHDSGGTRAYLRLRKASHISLPPCCFLSCSTTVREEDTKSESNTSRAGCAGHIPLPFAVPFRSIADAMPPRQTPDMLTDLRTNSSVNGRSDGTRLQSGLVLGTHYPDHQWADLGRQPTSSYVLATS